MWEKMINPGDNKIHADLNKVVNHISPINQPMIIIPNAGKQVVKLLASYIVKDVVNMFSKFAIWVKIHETGHFISFSNSKSGITALKH